MSRRRNAACRSTTTGNRPLINVTETYIQRLFEADEVAGAGLTRDTIRRELGANPATVAQNVARLLESNLVDTGPRRPVVLTLLGQAQAIPVVRKHRLVECFLVEIVGLEWPLAHQEARRWQHVISDEVERRVVALLSAADTSPYGNPVPGLAALFGRRSEAVPPMERHVSLAEILHRGRTTTRIRTLSERLQDNQPFLVHAWEIGAIPGREVEVSPGPASVRIRTDAGCVDIGRADAVHLLVDEVDGRPYQASFARRTSEPAR
ncbi:metal-dependent transcriptional regulator [Pseudonocardia ailaonensis]|uniref:Metal-dependent transcriptional regulator n=1 Tax=Pseudonocardia ailaonensis TaxID=367279 RepID=A0ABN2MKN6_9PSEU